MSRVILGVTGSVAALRTPALFRGLSDAGHEVRVIATEPSLHFFDPLELGSYPSGGGPLYRDRDEWPADRWQRDDPVLHIGFRDWADLLVVAPLDANTLGKLAFGLCDNFLSCLLRAWDFRKKPLILAPAMNTQMWENPPTRRHLRMLLEDHGDGRHPGAWALDDVASIFERHTPRIRLIAPQSKRLACGDVGVGAMAEVAEIVEAVRLASPLASV